MQTQVKGEEIAVIKLSNLKSRSLTVLGHQKMHNKHFIFLATPITNTVCACEVDVEITAHNKQEFLAGTGFFTITFDTKIGGTDRKIIFISLIREIVR